MPPVKLSAIYSQSLPVVASQIWNALPENVVSATVEKDSTSASFSL